MRAAATIVLASAEHPLAVRAETLAAGYQADLHGGGAALAVGLHGAPVRMPLAARIVGWSLTAMQAGDLALDIRVSNFAGVPAGTGARIALLNRAARDQIEATVHDIHKVETAIEPRFQEHFVNASAIPNAVDAFPELGKVVTLPDVSFNTGGSGGGEGGRRRRRG